MLVAATRASEANLSFNMRIPISLQIAKKCTKAIDMITINRASTYRL
jgi:hypothetical protein